MNTFKYRVAHKWNEILIHPWVYAGPQLRIFFFPLRASMNVGAPTPLRSKIKFINKSSRSIAFVFNFKDEVIDRKYVNLTISRLISLEIDVFQSFSLYTGWIGK